MSPKPFLETRVGQLPVSVYSSNQEMGQAAAEQAASVIQSAIRDRGVANIIVATGNSQLTFLAALKNTAGIDWSKVNVFHMDEYVAIDPEHPASFPYFLRRHFLDVIKPKAFYPVRGQAQDVDRACEEYAQLLKTHPADLTALGFGENGHLAFNDPPFANFKDPVWVKVVTLALASRKQQVGEGHFRSIDEVPTHAITLTIPALLAAKHVLAIVPESRKARAVDQALYGPVTPDCPASIMRTVAHARLYLDRDSARQLK